MNGVRIGGNCAKDVRFLLFNQIPLRHGIHVSFPAEYFIISLNTSQLSEFSSSKGAFIRELRVLKRLTFVIYLPSVLVPRFDLGLGERQGVGHVASVCHAQILLTAKLSLQVSELGMGERGSPSSGLPAAWRAAARSARLARSRCRRRWRECWRRTFQSGARAASRVDRVLRVRVNGRIVLGIFWKRKYVLSRIRRIDSCWATKSDTISNSCPIRRK